MECSNGSFLTQVIKEMTRGVTPLHLVLTNKKGFTG